MFDTIKRSLLAEILIGFGVIINLQMEVPVIGPMLFSFGLLTVIYMKAYLFTGKIGYVISPDSININFNVSI